MGSTSVALRRGRTRVLGLVMPSMQAGASEFIRGVSHAAREHGYTLAVCDGQNSMRVMERELERLYEERIDGLVLGGSVPAPRQIGRLIRAGVLLGPDATDPEWPRVQIDRGWAPPTREAFEALLENGHRRILFCVPMERDEGYLSSMTRFRIRCLVEGFAVRGDAYDPDLVLRFCSPDGMEPALRAFLAGREPVTAVVAGDAAFLPSILRTLGELALAVPRDVSVLSFGEAGWESTYFPRIAAVRHDCFGVGYKYTSDLIDRIEGRPIVDPMRRFPAEFERRESIGRVRGNQGPCRDVR
jgi:LacI family transcriptional regulator